MSAQQPTSTGEKVARGSDWVLTIVLICAQGLASVAIGLLSLLFAMISDGCFDEPDDPLICSDTGAMVFFGGIAVEWLLLLAGVVVSLVLSLRAAARGRMSWPMPFIGAGIGLVGVIVMIVAVAISAS